jgi:hypothetical protein
MRRRGARVERDGDQQPGDRRCQSDSDHDQPEQVTSPDLDGRRNGRRNVHCTAPFGVEGQRTPWLSRLPFATGLPPKDPLNLVTAVTLRLRPGAACPWRRARTGFLLWRRASAVRDATGRRRRGRTRTALSRRRRARGAALRRWRGRRSTARGENATHSTLHGLFWLTANVLELGPALFAVDDLHWCDSRRSVLSRTSLAGSKGFLLSWWSAFGQESPASNRRS